MYFDFARDNCTWRPPVMAIAALAVCLSGCVIKKLSTTVARRSEVAAAPAPMRRCTVEELQRALAAKESGYGYELHCI